MPNQYGYSSMMNQYPTSQQTAYGQRQDQIQQQYQAEENQRLQNASNIRRNSRVLSPQDRPTATTQNLSDRFHYHCYNSNTLLLLIFILHVTIREYIITSLKTILKTNA